jgi:hypothetical protein
VPSLFVKRDDALRKIADKYVTTNNAARKPVIVKNNHIDSSNSSCAEIPKASRDVDRLLESRRSL